MKKLFFFFLLLLVILSKSNSEPRYRKYLDTNKHFDLYDISDHSKYDIYCTNLRHADFIDSMNGILFYIATLDTIGLFKTTDNGKSWTQKFPVMCKVSSDSLRNISQMGNEIFYINKNFIVIPVFDYYSIDTLHEPMFSFLMSRDGGDSWQLNNFRARDSLQYFNIYYTDYTNRATFNFKIFQGIKYYHTDLLKNGFGIRVIGNEIYSTDNYFYNVSFVNYMDTIINKIYALAKQNNDTIPTYNYSLINLKIIDTNNVMLEFDLYNPNTFLTKDTKLSTRMYVKTNINFSYFEYVKPPNNILYRSNLYNNKSAFFLDSNKVWVIGQSYNLQDSNCHYIAFYTSNFGKSWTKKFDFPGWIFYNTYNIPETYPEIRFKNDSVGIIFGKTDKMITYTTTNAGETWNNIFSIYDSLSVFANDIEDVYIKPDNNLIFCISADGTNGALDIITYKMDYDSSVTTNVNEKTEIIYDNYFYSYPSYPCPTMSYVKCLVYWYQNLNIDNSILGVFNPNGVKVSDKNQIKINKTTEYSAILEWNCSLVESGPYFIVINHNGKMNAIPVMVVK